MRKISIVSVAIAILALFSILNRGAGAERVLTDAQMTSIANSCQMVQVELDSLHSSDALMRVNVGQQYSNILTSLMSPLNSRLALNQIDTVSLVTVSVDYNEALTDFRSKYSTYETSLQKTIDMKCEQDPARFYGAIETARKNRQALHGAIKELNTLLLRYQKEYRSVGSTWKRDNE